MQGLRYIQHIEFIRSSLIFIINELLSDVDIKKSNILRERITFFPLTKTFTFHISSILTSVHEVLLDSKDIADVTKSMQNTFSGVVEYSEFDFDSKWFTIKFK